MNSFTLWPGSLIIFYRFSSLAVRIHFQHSGAKIRVFEENTGIIKFWLFYSAAGHEYSVVFTRLFESSRGLCVFLVMDVS